jgi:hypothetical protein
VYAVIDGERDYQTAGEGNALRHADAPPHLLPGEVLACIEKCRNDALDAWYKPNGGVACLPFIRKIAALSIGALENYGAPARAEHDPSLPNSAE